MYLEDEKSGAKKHRVLPPFEGGKLKVQTEAEKVQAEMKKVQGENIKVQAETKKVQGESIKVQAETKKVQTENIKFQAEMKKFQARNTKVQAETKKVQAETGNFIAFDFSTKTFKKDTLVIKKLTIKKHHFGKTSKTKSKPLE